MLFHLPPIEVEEVLPLHGIAHEHKVEAVGAFGCFLLSEYYYLGCYLTTDSLLKCF